MTQTSTATAPDFTARDTYAGRHIRWNVPAGMRAIVVTAGALAAIAPEGAIWESAGHVSGRELFGRSRYIADAAGNLHVYDSAGRKVIVHPADRRLRVLAR